MKKLYSFALLLVVFLGVGCDHPKKSLNILGPEPNSSIEPVIAHKDTLDVPPALTDTPPPPVIEDPVIPPVVVDPPVMEDPVVPPVLHGSILFVSKTMETWESANLSATTKGGRLPSIAELKDLFGKKMEMGLSDEAYWSSEKDQLGKFVKILVFNFPDKPEVEGKVFSAQETNSNFTLVVPN